MKYINKSSLRIQINKKNLCEHHDCQVITQLIRKKLTTVQSSDQQAVCSSRNNKEMGRQ